jgi:endonuclease YncB( thermonuclease family)
MGWRDGILTALCVAMCGCTCAVAQAQPGRASICGGDLIAGGTVSRVIDGRTFALEDGREVRLAGIEVAPLPLSGESPTAPGGAEARDALAALLAESKLVLRRGDIASDRYGRVLAYAFASRDGGERFVQAELIAAGLARVAARVGGRDCAAELFGRETAARRAKLGLWAYSYYDLLNAANPCAGRARPFRPGRG